MANDNVIWRIHAVIFHFVKGEFSGKQSTQMAQMIWIYTDYYKALKIKSVVICFICVICVPLPF